MIAKWEQTKWLVLSSYFFIFPSFYAFFYKLYFYFILLFLTSLISANFWRIATYSWRRNMDLVFAKISFTVFVYNGIIYIKTPFFIIISYSGLFFIFYLYYLSGKLFNEKNFDWVKFHFLFHIILTFEQFIILYNILETKKNYNLLL